MTETMETINTSSTVVSNLNQLLIDYQVHYQNLRLFHWNVKGPFFFMLHEKFEELYLEAAERIDEVAERILALDGTPKGSLASITAHATIPSSEDIVDANDMVKAILDANAVLVKNLTTVLSSAGEAEDEGTLDIFTGYIREIEKQNWMLKAFLK
ncbi:MAG: Dps family protein [Roseivirga sp.]